MAFLSSIDISGSALTAQRLRMDVISANIANAETIETDTGEPYRRRLVVMNERKSSFADELGKAISGGVKVDRIIEDASDFEVEYDPTHPLADANGYVRMPNVDEVEELIDLVSATRSFEANLTALNATKSLALKALEIRG